MGCFFPFFNLKGVQGGSNSSEAGQRPVNLSDLAKLLHLTDNLTKEEEIEKIIEKCKRLQPFFQKV